MVTKYRTVKKEYEAREFVSRHCDWCGLLMAEDYGEEKRFDERNLTVEFSTGTNYPDSGYKEGWQVEDLCNTCVEKLKDLLEKSGILVSKLEVVW